MTSHSFDVLLLITIKIIPGALLICTCSLWDIDVICVIVVVKAVVLPDQ